MEQRNNLVLQGTETFSRGQLDNVALDGGALVLDSVAGRCLQYGSYEFAAQYCDRCGLLFDGKIVAEDDAVEFFSQNRFYTTASARLTRGFFSGAVTSTAVRERLAMVKRGQYEQ